MVIIMVICFIVAGQNNFASTELAEMFALFLFIKWQSLLKVLEDLLWVQTLHFGHKTGFCLLLNMLLSQIQQMYTVEIVMNMNYYINNFISLEGCRIQD